MNYAFSPEEDFKELNQPKYNAAFGWYVMAKDTTMENLWFLATDGNVRLRDKTTGFFFATELEAHYSAVKYYDNHKELYPHGSLVMEFK